MPKARKKLKNESSLALERKASSWKDVALTISYDQPWREKQKKENFCFWFCFPNLRRNDKDENKSTEDSRKSSHDAGEWAPASRRKIEFRVVVGAERDVERIKFALMGNDSESRIKEQKN